MKRPGTKKNTVERRKKPRERSKQKPRTAVSRNVEKQSARTPHEDSCYHCAKQLNEDERALFVEEEVGRIFCSESCITSCFSPEIERLEKEYLRKIPPGDLNAEEREGYLHLRWITLQEADEAWREKTLSGDFRYTLISEFRPSDLKIWCVCICLFLRGEPSFLYLAFTTKNAALVNSYRRGERIAWDPTQRARENSPSEEAGKAEMNLGDRLADSWTEDETFLAQINQTTQAHRSQEDIPPEEFELFQSCLEETLEEPGEVWSVEMTNPDGIHVYHFIREYPNEKPSYWYVIVARETENEEQIEIMDAFPTRDPSLVDRYRRGRQEVGESPEPRSTSRLVH